jgi:penicillin amidase
VDELCACFASYPTLSESRIFADVGGRIAWQMTGDAPIRRGCHGLVPAPGWDPRVGWEDGVRDKLPRIAERLEDRSDWSVEACQRLQLDRVSILWREVKEAVLDAGRAAPAGSDAATATRLLEAWDGDLAPSSAAASVFVVSMAELMVRIGRAAAPNAWRSALGTGINGVLPHGAMALRRWSDLSRRLRDPARVSAALVRDALADAVSRLRRRGGPDPAGWAWGTVRPLRLVHPVAEKPPLDRVFSLPPIAVGGDFTTIPQASVDVHDPLGNPVGVANLRGVIDVGAWESSRWSLAGGQSGNPCSPHFGDLLPVWERGEGVSIAWAPESVARRARATLRLRPSSA